MFLKELITEITQENPQTMGQEQEACAGEDTEHGRSANEAHVAQQ